MTRCLSKKWVKNGIASPNPSRTQNPAKIPTFECSIDGTTAIDAILTIGSDTSINYRNRGELLPSFWPVTKKSVVSHRQESKFPTDMDLNPFVCCLSSREDYSIPFYQ